MLQHHTGPRVRLMWRLVLLLWLCSSMLVISRDHPKIRIVYFVIGVETLLGTTSGEKSYLNAFSPRPTTTRDELRISTPITNDIFCYESRGSNSCLLLSLILL